MKEVTAELEEDAGLKKAFPEPEEVEAFTDDESDDELEDDPYLYCYDKREHSWRVIIPVEDGRDMTMRYCYRCKKYDFRDLMDQMKSISEPMRTEIELQQVRIDKMAGDLSGYQSDLHHQQAITAQAREELSELGRENEILKRNERAVMYAAKREALAHMDTEAALNALSVIVPLLDRGIALADVVAMYREMADRHHKFSSSIRRANPDHPSWTQMDALGVASVLVSERNAFKARLAEVYRSCGNPGEDLKETLTRIRGMTRGAEDGR
jgi:hypothetical protein